MVFNKGGSIINKHKFTFGSDLVEIVQHYCYLGIMFSACGTFNAAIKHLMDKSTKALFKLKQIDPRDNAILALKIFDSLISPILTYAYEVWGPFLARDIYSKKIQTYM